MYSISLLRAARQYEFIYCIGRHLLDDFDKALLAAHLQVLPDTQFTHLDHRA